MYFPLRQSNHWKESESFCTEKKKKQNREKQHQEMGQHWLLALRTGSAACLGHTWKVHTAIAYQAFNEQSSQRWRLLMSSKSWAHYIFFFLNHTIQLFMCKWFVQRGFSDIAIETTTTFISHLTSKKKKKKHKYKNSWNPKFKWLLVHGKFLLSFTFS